MSLRALLSGGETPVTYTLRENGELSKKFFMSVGVPVHLVRPEQNLPLLRLGMQSAGFDVSDTYGMLHEAAKLYREDFKHEVKRLVGKDATELKFRSEYKRISRMQDKELSDRESDVTSPACHTDVDGVYVFAKSIEAFQRISNKLRPANNSHVAQFKERAVNPEDSQFPGNIAKYVLTRKIGTVSNVPFVVEIQVLMDGSQEFCNRSHRNMDIERGIEKFISGERKGCTDTSVLVSAGKLEGKTKKSKPKINLDLAHATGLDRLRQEREFYLIDGMPVAYVESSNGERFCFIPDVNSGFYREENSYLPKLRKEDIIPRKDFITYALALVPTPDLSKSGSNVRLNELRLVA